MLNMLAAWKDAIDFMLMNRKEEKQKHGDHR